MRRSRSARLEASDGNATYRPPALTKVLANPATYTDPEAAPRAGAEYNELMIRLPEMGAAWEAASNEAEGN